MSITITDDGGDFNTLKIKKETEVTETKVEYDGTMNDLITDIARSDARVATENATNVVLKAQQTEFQTEIDKLPARVEE